MDLFEKLRFNLSTIMKDNALESEEIDVRVKALMPEEAIGNPEDRDYPITKGRERMMEAHFRGSRGQAFTDMYGEFSGTLAEVTAMKLTNNYRRAIFLATLNAVARHLGIVRNTVHCKDDQPPLCAKELARYVKENFGHPKVALVGLQPRMVEALGKEFELRVTDMDSENIGTTRFGAVIMGPEHTEGNISWCDVALVTGTTLTNDTIRELLTGKQAIFYGVTIAAPAHFLDLKRFCPFGT
jgi:Putative heavy-metal chelation